MTICGTIRISNKYQVIYFIKIVKYKCLKRLLREWILLLEFLVCALAAQWWYLSTSHISHIHTRFNQYLHYHFLFCYHTEFDKRKWCWHNDEKFVVCTILLYPHFPCIEDKDFLIPNGLSFNTFVVEWNTKSLSSVLSRW